MFYAGRNSVPPAAPAYPGKPVAGRPASGLARGMDLERFDPGMDAGSVRACHGIYLAAARADNPRWPAMSLPVFQSWMTYGWTEDPSQAWLARDQTGTVCGRYVLNLPER